MMNSTPYIRFALRFLAFSTLLASCDLGEVPITDFTFGSDYYPLEPYRHIDYRVSEINYSALVGNDTSEYFLREAVVDSFTDVSGQLNFRLERFKKDSLNANWVIDSIWSARVDRARIVKEENAVPFIKLILPEAARQSWDANAINSLNSDNVEIIHFADTFSSGQRTFPNTLTVEQANFNSIVNKDVRFEVYAKEIGLVYKYSETLQYIADTQDPRFNTEFITSGRRIEYRFFDLVNPDSPMVIEGEGE